MKTIAGFIEALGSSLGMGLALLARARGQPSATPEAVQSFGNTFERVVTQPQPRSVSPHTVIQSNSHAYKACTSTVWCVFYADIWGHVQNSSSCFETPKCALNLASCRSQHLIKH